MGRHYSFLLSPSLAKGAERSSVACWRWSAWVSEGGATIRTIGQGRADTYRAALIDAMACIADQHEPEDSEYT